MLKIPALILSVFLITAGSAFAQYQNENLTITTYYPSPYGVYRSLEVKRGLAVGGSGYSTVSKLTEGQLFINNSLILNGYNTTPPNSNGREGQVIYVQGTEHIPKYHNGTQWVNLTGGWSVVTSASCPAGSGAALYHWVAGSGGILSVGGYYGHCCGGSGSIDYPAVWSFSAPELQIQTGADASYGPSAPGCSSSDLITYSSHDAALCKACTPIPHYKALNCNENLQCSGDPGPRFSGCTTNDSFGTPKGCNYGHLECMDHPGMPSTYATVTGQLTCIRASSDSDGMGCPMQ